MQEASMSLQSVAVLPPFKETPITNAQLHSFNRRLPITPKCSLPIWTRRRLLVTNAAQNPQERSKEIRLDQQDLMTIEFGRLLGESKEKTISKVIRRKIDPGSSYMDLEKKAKAGKELVNKANFALKVDKPGGGSRNGSILGTDEPRLAFPPSRRNGSHMGLPKIGETADAQEVLDDSLLRKPLSSQHSMTAPPIVPFSSMATNNVKRPNSQHMEEVEHCSVDLELRRPSLDKGQDVSSTPPNPSNELKGSRSSSLPKFYLKSGSQSLPFEVAKLPEDNDSLEASRLEFQHLLDKASNTSTTNVASSPVRPSHLSTESTSQDGFRLVDLASALPSLASPPSRHRGSIGTFVQPAQTRNKTAAPSIKSPTTSDILEDSLLRKPGVPASPDVTTSLVQSYDDFQSRHDNHSPMPPKANVQSDFYEASAKPQLAAPPSRHTGTIGTFVQPSKTKVRETQSRKEAVYSPIDEFLLRKPSAVERPTSLVSGPTAEASTAPLSISKDTQRKEETLGGKLSRLQVVYGYEIDNDIGSQIDGLKQDVSEKSSQADLQSEVSRLLASGTSNDTPRSSSNSALQGLHGSNARKEALYSVPAQQLEPGVKLEGFAQTLEVLADPSSFDGSFIPREEGIGLSAVIEPGESKDSDASSAVKSVKVAALKKPVRNLSSESEKAFASEVKIGPDSSQALFINLDSESFTGNLVKNDLKTVCEAEESVDSTLRLDRSKGGSSLTSDEASSRDEERAHMVQEQFTETPGAEGITVPLDEASTPASLSADKEAERDSLLLQPKKMLRRPSQLLDAEFTTHGSQHMDLLSSNPKLHQAKEEEENDWARAEALLKAKEQVEVKLIGSNSAGLFVSFGCLLGFLPLFELSTKRGLVDFGTWVRQKGFEVGQKNTVKGAYDGGESGTVTSNVVEGRLFTGLEGSLNELREKYKEEISKRLSSFVGEKTKVIVKLLDKGRRKLRVSEKEADPGCLEHLQKKANLMAELKLGDVVTCQVKSITPIGVFVEVDDVPALIHHSEVSWNTRVDPASLLSIGKLIKAKVCRLDRTLQRINLSLKQMQPDPLKRTLESVVGDVDMDIPVHEIEPSDTLEMDLPELADLLRKLEQMDHILSVSKGRCLYSAAFAPSFQVLISTSQSNGYKLLARFENKIQEVLVQTTLDREKMKECIRLCTFSEA